MRPGSVGKSRLRGPRMAQKYRNYYVVLFSIILLGILVTGVLQFWPHHIDDEDFGFNLPSNEPLREVVIPKESPLPRKGEQGCTFHTCFDVYHCGYNDDSRISVYIYPPAKYVDENGVPITLPISREFSDIVKTVADSVYYTTDAEKACLFLPPIDLLNQNSIRLRETAQILASLQWWVWHSVLNLETKIVLMLL